MERKIGDVFTFDGKQFKVIEEADCDECYFQNLNCVSSEYVDLLGECTFRDDDKVVCFKLVEE